MPPGSVDLLAPAGVIDAGDAGIRSAGNLTLAATQILNASNIAVSGTSAGAPAVAPAAPAVSSPAPPPPPATKAPGETAAETERKKAENAPPVAVAESVVTVEVLGYGGSDATDPLPEVDRKLEEDEEAKKRRKAAAEAAAGQTEPGAEPDAQPAAPAPASN